MKMDLSRNVPHDPTVGLPRLSPGETVVFPIDDEPVFEEEVIQFYGNFDEEYTKDNKLHTSPVDPDDSDDPWVDLGRYCRDHPVES